MTPEEAKKSIDLIMSAFDAIQKNLFRHSVRSSGPVRDVPIDQLKDTTFLVRGGPRTFEMNLDEYVALVHFVNDQKEQLRQAGPDAKNFTIKTTVTLDHEPESKEQALKSWKIIEPNDPMKFTIDPVRLQHVMNMAKKKANAALTGVKGMHFWVFPPKEYLDNPGIIDEPNVYDRMKATTWWVKWWDGKVEPLDFGELVLFVDQIHAVHRAMQEAYKAKQKHDEQLRIAERHRKSKHAGGWTPKKDRSKPKPDTAVQVNVEGGIDLLRLVEDDEIRDLFKTVDIEKRPLPETELNG